MLDLPGLREACEDAVPPMRPLSAERARAHPVHDGQGRDVGRRRNPRGARPRGRPQAGRRGRELLRPRDARGRSRDSRSRRSTRPAPATASARPSSVAGCATCRRPSASPTPPRAGPWRSRDRDRWKGRCEPGGARRLSGGAFLETLRNEPRAAVPREGASDRRRRRASRRSARRIRWSSRRRWLSARARDGGF